MDRNQTLNDPETATNYALDGRQARIWTAMPGIVQSVDLVRMTCSVQPAIQGVQTLPNETTQFVNLPLLVDVPICFPSAGGFLLTLPMSAGDEVLVILASRCIDSWWQNGGFKNVPMESRMHDLSDGFAIPGPRSQPKVVSGISSANAQLRNDAGTVYLEITPAGGINMTAPSGVAITGDLSVTGKISATADVIAASGGTPIHLLTHRHPIPGGDTGTPVP